MFRFFILLSAPSFLFAMNDPLRPLDFSGTGDDIVIEEKESNYGKIIEIEALIVNRSTKVAKISGRSYKVGDTVGLYKIIDITVDKVLLEDSQTKETFEVILGHRWPQEKMNKGVR